MEPVDAVVREAVLHSFAAAAPDAAPFPPPAWEAEGEAVPQQLLLDAQVALGYALYAAYSAGLDPSLVSAAASAAGAAYAAARVSNRVAAAALHNDDVGPEGPEVLLPLADDVLVHFIDKLHSDRCVVRAGGEKALHHLPSPSPSRPLLYLLRPPSTTSKERDTSPRYFWARVGPIPFRPYNCLI